MTDEDSSQTQVPAEEQSTPPEADATPKESQVESSELKAVPSTQDSDAPSQTAHIPVNESLPSAQQAHSERDLLVKARATIQDRKHKKLEKILEALDGKGPTTLKLRRAGKITNDEVEKLLHVSDATATRYLSQLEKEGKIKQIGKTGKAVTYAKP